MSATRKQRRSLAVELRQGLSCTQLAAISFSCLAAFGVYGIFHHSKHQSVLHHSTTRREASITKAVDCKGLECASRLSTSYDGSWKVVSLLPHNSTVMLTFTNGGYSTLMLNWVMAARSLSQPHLVAVFDEAAADICRKNNVPWVWADARLSSENFRKDLNQFRVMGSKKPQLVLDLLAKSNVSAVAMSDTDTVWLRPPPLLWQLHPEADVLMSTDCLSHQAEVTMKKNHIRCGHTPGSTYQITLNTGAIIFRNTPGAVAVLTAWRRELSNKAKNLTVFGKDGKATGLRLTDQMEMNYIMGRDIYPITSASKTDPRVIYAYEKKVKLLPIPAALAAGGHTFFLQHRQQLSGITPFVVHTTFHRHGTVAKVVRFREEGLWHLDPDEYYTKGRYITYECDVEAWVAGHAAEWKLSTGRDMVPHHRHMLAALYQTGQVLDAMAIAHAVNRTLVLPRFVCWCDQDYYPNVLANCTLSNSDLQLPFECPADIYINPEALEYRKYNYRVKSFLTSPRVPLALSRSQVQLAVVRGWDGAVPEEPFRAAEAAAALAAGEWTQRDAAMTLKGAQVSVAHGARSGTWAAALSAYDDVFLVSVTGLVPGSFGGFEGPQGGADAKAVDAVMSHALSGMGWCCSGQQWETQWKYVYWNYGKPTLLAARRPGEPVLPSYERPPFCDEKVLTPENEANKKFQNHPCTYLAAKGQA